ncbi:ATPase family associated with various cellular activities (AAA) [Nesidiocoris tenuis]|uniref:Midasin n=2 Tax=Nesidiocoris tenuis TaxID=355587 RepID=A0ABN7BAT8_9HEMI|nr:ATPase family associated with various cellular activities (AAA) [Nesidiocoris tenuis]
MGTSEEFARLFFGFRKLQKSELFDVLEAHVTEFCSYEKKDWNEKRFYRAIHVLSDLLITLPQCVDVILDCFLHVCTRLVSTVLEKDVPDHQTRYILLAKLFSKQTCHIRSYLKYFAEEKPPWVPSNLESSKHSKKRKLAARQPTELEVVECCWNLLKADFQTFSTKWCWASFIGKFTTAADQQVVWVACQCTAKILCMDEVAKNEFMSKLLPAFKVDEYQLHYERLHSLQTTVNFPSESDCDNASSSDAASKAVDCAKRSFTDVSGVLLPIFNKDFVNCGNLIPVKSTQSNLRKLAIGVSTGKAIGLIGPVGSGKSALVDHLAHLTGRRPEIELLKIQLGEETDSKLLLGTYKCTDIPGEFVWESGVLTKAVMEGHWLLIEDIESAANDVAAVLANLLEHGSINVPGYRDNVRASPGFHLFMTHRSLAGRQGHHRKLTVSTELLEKHWMPVNVEPLTTDELVEIVQTKFTPLKTIATRMVSVYLLFSMGEHTGAQSSSRQPGQRLTSTRDLLKWCARAEIGFEVTSQESALKVLQDAIDIFCCSYSDLAFRCKIAGAVAACLGIIKTKAEYFCNLYKPSIALTSKSCVAGRVNMDRLESDEPVSLSCLTSELKFALTRESCCLLERLAICLTLNEPVLLVGETGTGKTTTIQLLAKHTRHQLVVINMNQQSDSSDLLGGFKPVDVRQTIQPLREEFESLFRSLFNVQTNQKFLENISVCVSKRMWNTLLKMMSQSQKAAVKRLTVEEVKSPVELTRWRQLGVKIDRLIAQMATNQSAMAFSFIEGSLVKALKEGQWVLLDEINLACAETLQCLSGLLEGSTGSVSLLERGDSVKISRHPNFRLLAAMNPATDFGKKDLPASIRNRFTEFFVSEHSDKNDLCLVVNCYLPDLPHQKVESVVKFYLLVRKKAAEVLVDSTGHKPLYSLRTLCRGLVVAAENKCGNMNRSLYEGLCLSFLTQLNASSHVLVKDMIAAIVLDADTRKSVLSQPIPEPIKGGHVNFEGYWVQKGPFPCHIDEKYLLTPSVRKNLCDIARCVSLSNYPVLIQGETSVGKTSLVTYLAQAAGHRCFRINNHQHTDLQEYVGTYCADPVTGSLVFREGVLVEAMRQGHWIILDELNLAPSEVLEALNRVLDDNRELFITETQVTVKAHPSFRLFATQNPPGIYGGRKVLSKAFRNRFVEMHFDEIPPAELENILQHRCSMPLSYCKKLVAVMSDLQIRRRGSATFAGKLGFITLRDLFRWGERYRLAQSSDPGRYYDWDQHIADEGYLVLAGRVRKAEECEIIRSVLEKRIKRKVNADNLFTLKSDTSVVTKHILESIVAPPLPPEFEHIVWTYNLRKTAVLVGKAIEYSEPLLLVGETGCGKTTICQLIALIRRQKLHSVNCHQHSESSDFLGGLRPVRDQAEQKGKLFEWVDGPLIRAMKEGMMFLADEISLADDSVLERLNSLLEPERKLMVSEKGNGEEIDIIAEMSFRFIGTMNPGGDFGKKELSPALRNRLTEIWCEGPTKDEDLITIVEHNVKQGLSLGDHIDGTSGVGKSLVDFLNWFKSTEIGKKVSVSVRDVLTWVRFINLVATPRNVNGSIDVTTAYIHGAHLTLLDGIGTAATSLENVEILRTFRNSCVDFLLKQIESHCSEENSSLRYHPTAESLQVVSTPEKFGVHPFYVDKVSGTDIADVDFTFEAPTTCLNTLRLLRSLQIPSRAILLEGSPGVGKTSIVAALAKATGHQVTRINLSEQTDVSDLFGADLPVEGAPGGTFAWRDGPFLKALKKGHWILLDELNLASQSVVEGLNSVLDHRGEIFVPELGRTFRIKPNSTRLFACQNPQKQGCARKGLPRSFLNRFTQVFVEPLSKEDLLVIVKGSHPTLDSDLAEKMIQLTYELNGKAKTENWAGGPWEWNLRDLSFWIKSFDALDGRQIPGAFVKTIYADRLRRSSERQSVLDTYSSIFGPDYPLARTISPVIVSSKDVLLGEVNLKRGTGSCGKESVVDSKNSQLVLRYQIPTLKSLALCIRMGWLAILVGDSYCGKSSVVKTLAQLVGKKVYSIPVSSAMDTTELLGGFEQTDFGRHLDSLHQKVESMAIKFARLNALKKDFAEAGRILQQIRRSSNCTNGDSSGRHTLGQAVVSIKRKIDHLFRVVDDFLENCSVVCREDTDRLDGVKKELIDLNDCVDKQGALAGGNFEWVDSILVKCLQEGNWLVVDNVNLCSGAVLDRLNGLLEPDGVLVLGERGVGPDSEEVVIRPHEDFRIIFTMDPARGNISRAMRNRGVEIFMEPLPIGVKRPSVELDFTNFSCELDVISLLYNMGYRNSLEAMALLHIHSKLLEHCSGYEMPSIRHFLEAAFLSLENCKGGESFESAVRSAFTEIYINSKPIGVEQRLKLTSALSDLLTKLDWSSSENFSFMGCFGDCVMLRSAELDESSALECVRTQGALLYGIIRIFSTLSTNLSMYTFQDFESLSNTGEAAECGLLASVPYLVIGFYSFASRQDVELRHSWLARLVESLGESSTVQQICKRILETSCLIKETLQNHLPPSGLPWDYRQLSSVSSCGDSLQNKIYALICYRIVLESKREETSRVERQVDWKSLTILQYSKAVKQGLISDLPTNLSIVCEMSTLFCILETIIVGALTSDRTSLTTEKCWKWLLCVAWKIRLMNSSKRRLFSTSGQVSHGSLPAINAESMSNVIQHYKWFRTRTLPMLIDITSGDVDLENKMSSLMTLIRTIDLSVNLGKIHLVPLCRRIVDAADPPPPMRTVEQCDLAKRIHRFENNMEVWRPDTLNFETFVRHCHFLASDSGQDCRLQMIAGIEAIYRENNLDDCLSNTKNLDSLTADLSNPSDKISSVIKLWPFFDLIAFRLNAAVRSGISSFGSAEDNVAAQTCLNSLIDSFVDVSKSTGCVRPVLVGITKTSSDEGSRTSQMDVLTQLFSQLYSDPIVRSPVLFLEWDHNRSAQELEESFKDKQIELCPQDPALALYLSCFINNLKQSSTSSFALKSHSTTISAVKQLKTLLWRNLPALSSKKFKLSHNEDLFLKNSYHTFKTILNKNLSVEGDQDSFGSACQALADLSFDSGRPKGHNQLVSPVVETLKSLDESMAALTGRAQDSPEWWIQLGKCWALLGYAQSWFATNLDLIDPVNKEAMKRQYRLQELEEFKILLYAQELTRAMVGAGGSWPFKDECTKKINELKEILKEKEGIAVRPYPSSYNKILEELNNIMNSLLAHNKFQEIISHLSASKFDADWTTRTRNEVSSWLMSIRSIHRRLESQFYPSYPDIVTPALLAFSQVIWGVQTAVQNIDRFLAINKSRGSPSVHDILSCMSSVNDLHSSVKLVDICQTARIHSLLSKASKSSSTSPMDDGVRLLKILMRTVLTLRDTFVDDASLHEPVLRVLEQITCTWEKLQEESKIKKAQEESIYINKLTPIQIEEDQLKREMSQLFPVSRDRDFSDLEAPETLEEAGREFAEEPQQKESEKLADDIKYIEDICDIHRDIVRTSVRTPWLVIGKDVSDSSMNRKLLDDRMHIFWTLISGPGLKTTDDRLTLEAITALLVSLSQTASASSTADVLTNGSPSENFVDFYRDPNIEEAQQCVALLNIIQTRVAELLGEWPDHPTLKLINEIIARVLGFPITCPLARFLTGLELLLTRLHEWEENAHAGVSLAPHAASLTNQIISWRRLELSAWKGALITKKNTVAVNARKWWFHLYSLTVAFLRESSDLAVSSELLTKALQQFMEGSNLGEYSARLQLLFTFHCHCLLKNDVDDGEESDYNRRQELLVRIYWNLHQYYKQFEQHVSNKIIELGAPIEKKLKEFVKIARWNDINYWAVKASVEKTHRTVHKHIKEYERMLSEPAAIAMTKFNPSYSRIKLTAANFSIYLTQFKPLFSYVDDESSEDSSYHLHRLESLLRKCRRNCKQIILDCSYPKLLDTLDVHLQEWKEIGELINQSEIDPNTPEEKKTATAKVLLQRKRRAVAELFRTFAQLGLSYRSGLLMYEQSNSAFALLPPLDVKTGLSQIAGRSCDSELVTMWTGIEELFHCSVARFAQLKKNLEHSHKDLGPVTVERIKGYTAHLMQMNREIKESLSRNTQDLYTVRCLLHQISRVPDEGFRPMNSDAFHSNQKSLLDCLDEVKYSLNQFAAVLEAFPEKPSQSRDLESVPRIHPASNRPMVDAFKYDDQWQNTFSQITKTLRTAAKLKIEIEKFGRHRIFSKNACPDMTEVVDVLVDAEHADKLDECQRMLSSLVKELLEIIDRFGAEIDGEFSTNPLTICLEKLASRISSVDTQLLSTLPSGAHEETFAHEFTASLNQLVHDCLITVQNVYKNHVNNTMEKSKDDEHNGTEEEEKFVLEDDHVKEKISERLSADIDNFKIKNVCLQLKQLLFKLSRSGNSADIDQCARIARNAYPIFDQLVHLYQFFLTQKTSSLKVLSQTNALLLGIFTDFAKNGYNIPQDLQDEGEEGEGEGAKGGMGLGEGEGEKDVSEQIESLDQLEDAKRPEEYQKPEEHKDCQEEEKGIEMEEDFAGELQDMEKKGDDENDDENKEEDGEEPDKEMGDTEKGAETLDKEVWGSDSEEEEEDKDMETEEGNKGSEETQEELGAKNDDDPAGDDDRPDDKKRREQNKPEINEMEEPEVDDDQVDPYHGNHPPSPEVDPLEIPDDLDMDGDEGDDGDDKDGDDEENPFDIDKMKENAKPEEDPEDEEEKSPEDVEDKQQDGDNNDVGEDFDKPDVIEDENKDQNGETEEDDQEKDDGQGEGEKLEEPPQEESDETAETMDKPSEAVAEASEENKLKKDQVTSVKDSTDANKNERKEENRQDQGTEEDDGGAGAAERDQADRGGKRGRAGRDQHSSADKEREDHKRHRPGDSNIERSLGEAKEPVKKKLRTIDSSGEKDEGQEENENDDMAVENDDEADLYQHIKQAKEKSSDTQVVDAATKEQAEKQQPVINKEDEEGKELEKDDTIDQMDEDEISPDPDVAKLKPERSEGPKNKKDQPSGKREGDVMEEAGIEMEVEGEMVATSSVARGPESTYHTQMNQLTSDYDEYELLSEKDIFRLRQELQDQLASWSQPPEVDEARTAWERLCTVTSGLSRDLCEHLRLVLEPTTASGLKGDFRTGRRINMRKVIPYIASQFRKDKIWLRRSKPSKREYQIVMAIDDSSSMADNQSKELAFESLALVSRALNLLEAGDLAVLSFGESVKVLHELGQPFSDASGARLFQQLTFDQKRTKVGALVDFTTALLSSCAKKTDADVAQLLVILSDGRGVMSEGEASVLSAVRSAKHQRIFIIFVIIENPNSKDSILDIRQPCFRDGKLLGISSYMDNFPFPFYLILRDISNLPSVMSDAIRQWFELVTSSK